MFGLSAKPPVDAEEFDWLLACTAWLIPVLGGADAIRGQRLILPNDFPDPTTRGHARAIELFGQVRAFAGMAEWPCELVAGEEERSTRIADGFALKHETRGPPLVRSANRAAASRSRTNRRCCNNRKTWLRRSRTSFPITFCMRSKACRPVVKRWRNMRPISRR